MKQEYPTLSKLIMNITHILSGIGYSKRKSTTEVNQNISNGNIFNPFLLMDSGATIKFNVLSKGADEDEC